jgi:hypothetical protein
MQRTTRKTRNSVNSGFLSIIERYWLVIIGLIVGTPFLLRYLKDSSVKNYTNDLQEQIKTNATANLSPITQLSGMNKITTNKAYHDWALSLAKDLGTLYSSRASWYSIFDWTRSLTENDTAVYNSLKQVSNTGQKRILGELYFFLVQRNLNEDVVKLLDKELLAKLPLFT